MLEIQSEGVRGGGIYVGASGIYLMFWWWECPYKELVYYNYTGESRFPLTFGVSSRKCIRNYKSQSQRVRERWMAVSSSLSATFHYQNCLISNWRVTGIQPEILNSSVAVSSLHTQFTYLDSSNYILIVWNWQLQWWRWVTRTRMVNAILGEETAKFPSRPHYFRAANLE